MNKNIKLIESYMDKKSQYQWVERQSLFDLLKKSNGRAIHTCGNKFEVLKLTEILIGDGYIVDDSDVKRS